MKICKICNKEFELNFFRQHKNGTYEPYCVVCEKELNKQRCKVNYQKNKQKYLDRNNFQKEYRKKYDKEYKAKQRAESLNFKLRSNISSYINSCLKRKCGSKINKLPYSIEELKNHLESLFEPWMNWNNWGKFNKLTWNDYDQTTWTWHIDHIIPKSSFYYDSIEDDQFKECWSLKNLRPLSSKENILKSNKKIGNNII